MDFGLVVSLVFEDIYEVSRARLHRCHWELWLIFTAAAQQLGPPMKPPKTLQALLHTCDTQELVEGQIRGWPRCMTSVVRCF